MNISQISNTNFNGIKKDLQTAALASILVAAPLNYALAEEKADSFEYANSKEVYVTPKDDANTYTDLIEKGKSAGENFVKWASKMLKCLNQKSEFDYGNLKDSNLCYYVDDVDYDAMSEDIVAYFDKDNDNKISYDEFSEKLKNKNLDDYEMENMFSALNIDENDSFQTEKSLDAKEVAANLYALDCSSRVSNAPLGVMRGDAVAQNLQTMIKNGIPETEFAITRGEYFLSQK